MTTLERITHAELSSDLSAKPYISDVDILTAVGMAGIRNPGWLAVFRLKYLNDWESATEAKDQFRRWAKRSMERRGMDIKAIDRAAEQALEHWIDDTCHPCKGHGYSMVPGTPHLSDVECQKCRGSGRKPIKGPLAEVVNDVVCRAMDAVGWINGRVGTKVY